MAVPKKKMTSTRSGSRRAHKRATRPATTICSHCKAIIRPHIVCPKCGYYRGQKVK